MTKINKISDWRYMNSILDKINPYRTNDIEKFFPCEAVTRRGLSFHRPSFSWLSMQRNRNAVFSIVAFLIVLRVVIESFLVFSIIFVAP